MEQIKELEISEMIEISGGSKVAYELGYALGSAIKQFLFIVSVSKLFS